MFNPSSDRSVPTLSPHLEELRRARSSETLSEEPGKRPRKDLKRNNSFQDAKKIQLATRSKEPKAKGTRKKQKKFFKTITSHSRILKSPRQRNQAGKNGIVTERVSRPASARRPVSLVRPRAAPDMISDKPGFERPPESEVEVLKKTVVHMEKLVTSALENCQSILKDYEDRTIHFEERHSKVVEEKDRIILEQANQITQLEQRLKIQLSDSGSRSGLPKITLRKKIIKGQHSKHAGNPKNTADLKAQNEAMKSRIKELQQVVEIMKGALEKQAEKKAAARSKAKKEDSRPVSPKGAVPRTKPKKGSVVANAPREPNKANPPQANKANTQARENKDPPIFKVVSPFEKKVGFDHRRGTDPYTQMAKAVAAQTRISPEASVPPQTPENIALFPSVFVHNLPLHQPSVPSSEGPSKPTRTAQAADIGGASSATSTITRAPRQRDEEKRKTKSEVGGLTQKKEEEEKENMVQLIKSDPKADPNKLQKGIDALLNPGSRDSALLWEAIEGVLEESKLLLAETAYLEEPEPPFSGVRTRERSDTMEFVLSLGPAPSPPEGD